MIHFPVEKSNGDIETVTAYNYRDFPYKKYISTETVRGRRCVYYNIPATFDIETTTVSKVGYMYHWQFCLGSTVIFGRTWEEFTEFLNTLSLNMRLGSYTRLVVFCHFLGFEFQHIRNFLHWTSIFSRKKREPMKALCTLGYEFRCSYILSNMSLSQFCKNSALCTYYKKSGDDYDYTKVRTPSTPMTDYELSYCYCDVRGLSQCIETLLQDDTIATLPLTSTGFVRREFRSAMQSNPKNSAIIKKMALSLDQYTLCKQAFRGGDTHANVLYTGLKLPNITFVDIMSSYPAVMLTEKFPMTAFVRANCTTLTQLTNLTNTYACLFSCTLTSPRVKSLSITPYIDRAHCRNLLNPRVDNGRILSADSLTISLTDIDWRIISEEYDYSEVYIHIMYIAKYDYLPYELRSTLHSYFTEKCKLSIALKNAEPESEEYYDIYYRYNRFKNRINGAYGMIVTDILSPEILYENDDWHTSPEPDLDTKTTLLSKHYKSYSTFLSYQWGVWTPAHARARLSRLRHMASSDGIYHDTDSLALLTDPEPYITVLNNQIISQYSTVPDMTIPVTIDSKTFNIGTWDTDKKCKQFKTLGSKKYCYTDQSGKLHITVSGLGKKRGAEELLTKHKGIDSFCVGTIIQDSGRTTATYNDHKAPYTTTLVDYLGQPCTFSNASNIGVTPTTYEFGISFEYGELIKEIQKST